MRFFVSILRRKKRLRARHRLNDLVLIGALAVLVLLPAAISSAEVAEAPANSLRQYLSGKYSWLNANAPEKMSRAFQVDKSFAIYSAEYSVINLIFSYGYLVADYLNACRFRNNPRPHPSICPFSHANAILCADPLPFIKQFLWESGGGLNRLVQRGYNWGSMKCPGCNDSNSVVYWDDCTDRYGNEVACRFRKFSSHGGFLEGYARNLARDIYYAATSPNFRTGTGFLNSIGPVYLGDSNKGLTYGTSIDNHISGDWLETLWKSTTSLPVSCAAARRTAASSVSRTGRASSGRWYVVKAGDTLAAVVRNNYPSLKTASWEKVKGKIDEVMQANDLESVELTPGQGLSLP